MDLSPLFILLSLIIITILIVVHEFGHFLAAKYYGFQTPVFGIGLPFGPCIELFERWGTKFRFYWVLIGGFVSIPELGDETANEEIIKELKKPARSFPVHQRMVVAAGGIVFNILFAFLLCIIMAATTGLPKAVPDSSIAGFVSEESIAKQAQLQAGDKIIRIDGSDIHNGLELKDAIKTSAGKSITLTVKRSAKDTEQILTTTIQNTGSLGIYLGQKKEYTKFGFEPLKWIWESLKYTVMTFVLMLLSVADIFASLFQKLFSIFIPSTTPAADLGQVKGIVGIIQLISEDLQRNWHMILEFSVLLSLNLAVINVLPIPALDGGHLMFMSYEAIAGKKACEKFQHNAVQIGFVFLLSVMALTTFNDIKSWIFG